MKKKLNMKILSAILAFVTFLSCCPIICLASGDFAITHEGKAITRISVDKQEKLEVTAESIPEGTYQWQIEVPGADLWVNIQGQSSATLGLSYALVGSLLDGDTATLRCVAISGGEEIACSTELRVTITDKPEEKIEKSSFVPVILGPAEAATEAPTEAATEAPTEAATEAPTEAATEAPTEAATEAPTEAATEAPTETATEAPTEAATEAPAEAATEAPTKAATEAPTEAATEAPTEAATEAPTEAATEAPTEAATEAPTEAATEAPAEAATEAPAEDATEAPTEPRRFMMFAAAPRSTEATEPAEANTVLVQVHFVRLKAGSTTELVNVYAPYPAELQKGTPYSAKIPVLDHLGYKPSCDEVEIQTEGKQKFIELNYAAVEEDINIYVMYKPDNVHYAARYFIQNPYDDLYTEYRYVEKEGLTDSYPEEELAIDIPGFTKLYTQPEYIAADGSTEFQVYYDRNYYLYIFNPDGGHGTDPVYARHGTYLQIPDPVKTGWEFAGWDLGVASYENGKVVYTYDGVKDTVDSHVNINEFVVDGENKSYNKTYKALWTEQGSGYMVAYWIIGNNNQRAFLGSRYVDNAVSGDFVSGKDDMIIKDGNGNPTGSIHLCGDDGHTHTPDCYISETDLRYIDFLNADQNVVVKGDGSTVVNVNYEYREYTLKFYYAIEKITGTNSEYRVVGGTSHPFGWNDTDLTTALKRYTSGDYSDQCGTVDELPKLNPTGVARYGQNGAPGATFTPVEYTEGETTYRYNAYYDTIDDTGATYKFYYISLTARYNDDISQLWPCDVFKSVTRTSGNTHGNWTSLEAIASGWNGQYRVNYTRKNSNPTIKGVYERLDEDVLFKYDFELFTGGFNEYKEATEVGYLCFWENGMDKNWSVPELYVYNIWIACIVDELGNLFGKNGVQLTAEDLEKPDIKKVEVKTGEYQYFYLDQSYHTCDNSSIGDQTRPSLVGYYDLKYLQDNDLKNTSWGAIFLSNATLNGSTYTGGGGGQYDVNTQIVASQTDNGAWWYSDPQALTLTTVNGVQVLHSSEYDPNNPSGNIDHTMYREAYFRDYYYYPKPHKLDFYNYNGQLSDGRGVDLYFGTYLKKYGLYAINMVQQPEKYPSGLEPEAFEFKGWYTSPNFAPGTEVDWNTITMPDADLTVYAKWEPKIYDITFSVTYTDTTGAEVIVHEKIKDVQHGMPMDTSVVVRITEEVSQKPPVEGAQFAGWFYEDSMGRIIAFDPENMAVTEGMRLFAQWRTPIPVDYTVRYVYRDLHDTSVLREFVDDEGKPVITTGKAYLATTKTFPAKVFEDGDKLYFPELGSQSIVIDSDPEKNVVTFIYKQVEDLYYTVKCWDNTEKKWLLYGESGRRIETEKAVMDIQAPSIDGYLPTSAYERLYMSTDEEKNVVTFYYNKNVTEAHYVVHHMEQNLDDMLLYDDILTTDKVGTIDTTVSLELQNLEGFKFDPDWTVVKKLDGSTYSGIYTSNQSGVSAELPKEGLEIWLYYDRQLYSYIIQYLEVGTNKELGSKNGTNEKYGHELTLYTTGAEDSDVPDQLTIDGIDYLLKDGESVKTYIIRAENNQLVKYYYMPKTSVARYIAVTQGSGVPGGACAPVSETVNGEYLGSTPTANQGFYFAGWFKDNACTQLVTQADGEILTGSRLKPKYGQDGTFYALFKPYTLTIRQNGMKNEADSAIYDVIKGTNEVVARVMVTGNSSVTIQQISPGEYTVREVSGNWTWTYGGSDPVSRRVTVGEDANDVVFAYTHIGSCWLHGENCN